MIDFVVVSLDLWVWRDPGDRVLVAISLSHAGAEALSLRPDLAELVHVRLDQLDVVQSAPRWQEVHVVVLRKSGLISNLKVEV